MYRDEWLRVGVGSGLFHVTLLLYKCVFHSTQLQKKEKWNFHIDKTKRLSLPPIGIAFVLSPISYIIDIRIVKQPIYYIPNIPHG